MPEDSLEVGIYYSNTPSTSQPDYFASRSDTRQLKKSGLGGFINHGTAFRLDAPKDSDRVEQEEHGSMRDAWPVKESFYPKPKYGTGFLVMQMPTCAVEAI